jgi:hypothetical protein
MNTTTPNRVTWASVAATVCLVFWASLGLQDQTNDLLARCSIGPDPASCQLRLMGR